MYESECVCVDAYIHKTHIITNGSEDLSSKATLESMIFHYYCSMVIHIPSMLPPPTPSHMIDLVEIDAFCAILRL